MKKFIFGFISVTITFLLFEVIAYGTYSFIFGEYKLYDIQNSKINAIDALESSGVFAQGDFDEKGVLVKPILHPYVGFYIDGKKKIPNCQSSNPTDCYSRIKVATDKPFEKRANKKLIIGILGGSFADGTASRGKHTFIRAFKNSEQFKGYEVIIYNLANGAYKQPQHLMQLSFYYALGAEFDIIINLDGFNEIAASYYAYRDVGIHPSFPVSWNHRLSSSINKNYLDLYSDRKETQENHAQYANFWLTEGIRYSPTMNFIWKIIDQNHTNRLSKINLQMTKSGVSDNRDFAYEALGPDFNFTTWPDFFKQVAAIWSNSSLALNAMVEGQGAKYYHFLQPNQYIEGGKILSEWETKYAIIAKGGYGNVYKKNHSSLILESNNLLNNNVAFTDLSYMFEDNPATLYIDNCCHLNDKGYDIVARKIVSSILNSSK